VAISDVSVAGLDETASLLAARCSLLAARCLLDAARCSLDAAPTRRAELDVSGRVAV
jgi:hypothetical protein